MLNVSVPTELLEELATKAASLSPIMEVINLYCENNMIDDIPLFSPLKEKHRISSDFGFRIDPFTKKRKFHSGIDYACELATTVHAAASGQVIFIGNRGGYGKCVIIKHQYGFTSIYGHLSEYYVKEGMLVRPRQVIGFVGTTGRSTGYHLHYEVRKNNKVIKPLFINRIWDR